MSRVPPLERDGAPAEVQGLYDLIERLPAPPRLIGKVAAHSPGGLQLYAELTRTMMSMTLDPRLRELAFVATSRINRSAICDGFHSSLGRRVGLTQEQLDHLGDPGQCAAYSELERLVIRYAQQLGREGTVDDALYATLARHLSTRELVELAVAVAAAHFTNRFCAALSLSVG